MTVRLSLHAALRKKRRDLVEKIETVVKSSTEYDQELIRQITRTRYDSEVARSVEEQSKAEDNLRIQLNHLIAQTGNWPELTANHSFKKLLEAIETVENEIGLARRYYNALVREHNIRCEVFPSSVFASLLKMKQFQVLRLN